MLKNIFTNKDLRTKIFITLLVLVLYKIATYIPAPGINRDVLDAIIGSSDIFNLTSMVSGGAINQFSIVALGVMPYITASIIIQLLAFDVSKTLTEWKNQGEMGQKKTKRFTIYLAMVIALIQSVALTIGFNAYSEVGLLTNDVWWSYVIIALILTLGTGLLILGSKWIDNKGIGNGMSIIILGGILMIFPSNMIMLYQTFDFSGDNLFIEIIKAILLLLLFLILLVFVVFVSLSERRIPIKSTNNMKTTVGKENQNFLPFKLLAIGVIPVIFASSLVIIPTTVASFFPGNSIATFVSNNFALDDWLGMLFYVVFITLFTFFYMFIQLSPEKIADNLSKSNSFVPGIRPGNETEMYFKDILLRLSLVGSIILGTIAIIPTILSKILTLPLSVQIGGTSLIILVSVGLDVYKRIDVANKSQEMKKYSGIFTTRSSSDNLGNNTSNNSKKLNLDSKNKPKK